MATVKPPQKTRLAVKTGTLTLSNLTKPQTTPIGSKIPTLKKDSSPINGIQALNNKHLIPKFKNFPNNKKMTYSQSNFEYGEKQPKSAMTTRELGTVPVETITLKETDFLPQPGVQRNSALSGFSETGRKSA